MRTPSDILVAFIILLTRKNGDAQSFEQDTAPGFSITTSTLYFGIGIPFAHGFCKLRVCKCYTTKLDVRVLRARYHIRAELRYFDAHIPTSFASCIIKGEQRRARSSKCNKSNSSCECLMVV